MHFASPYYLWLLTALVPMAGYYVWRTLQGGAAIQISSVDGSLSGALVPDQDKDKFETCFVFNSEQMDSFASGKQRSRSNIIQMLERWML